MKSNIKILLAFLIINSSFLIKTNAQTHLRITGGNWICKDGGLVLKNTSLENNSNFDAGIGTVIVTGNAPTAQSKLGGSSSTTFYNLTINKSINNALLGQSVTVNNVLTLTNGKLEINNYNLTIGNSGNILGQNKDRYIKTNGTGFLIRPVGATWTAFPVGKVTFNPARLKNDGTPDNFKIRVEDHFLENGTAGANVTTNVIPKTWLIEEETPGGSNVSMRLIWRPLHHNNNGFDDNNATIAHYTGGAWQDLGGGASVADNSYSSDHRYREASNITSFSPFGARTVQNFPVELLYFYGEKEGNNVRLDWQTATEINNSHFDVEWSKDGINFEKIGEVAGAGTTNEVQFYEFFDDLNRVSFQNRHGLHYYRLKQHDFDGKYEYTNIISIEFQAQAVAYRIFPNPASHYLNIESEDLVGETIQIFSVNGQLVKEFQHQSPTTHLSITNLPSGTYFIKIEKEVKKLIVQK